jgi:hypothetical protein
MDGTHKLFSVLLLLIIVGSFLVSSDYIFHPVENHYLAEREPENGKVTQFGSPLSRCEYYALRLGTEIVDVINAPHNDHDTSERIYQDFVVENIGFAPWISEGLHGKTLTGNPSRVIHKKGGWIGRDIENSPYSVLNNKWIYFIGDSTTRQVWASYAAPFKANNFERNAKEFTRQQCDKQSFRPKHHPEHPGHYDEEGWRGPCGVNEVDCHVSGYGEDGKLSYDWKHFPYEDYDEFMWGENGPWRKGFPDQGTRRPDLLTLQFGLHTCWHANNEGLYSRHLKKANSSMIEKHEKDILKLMSEVRATIDSQNDLTTNKTTVIVLTSGLTGYGMSTVKTDACIQRMNRITKKAANAYGFAVLERGEIERRLMYTSLYYEEDPVLPVEMHLIQPAQNIVATSLLHLYQCLSRYNLSSSEFTSNGKKYPLTSKPAFRNWRFSAGW